MQYISDKLLVDTVEVSNYSDMFITLKNSIDKIEAIGDCKLSPIASICLEVICDDCISVYDLKNLSEKDYKEALELSIRLRDYIYSLQTSTLDTNIREVPKEFVPFFNVEKNIKFYSQIKSVKKISLSNNKKFFKSKIFF